MTEINTDGTDTIICPYCGHSHGVDYFVKNGTATCSKCDKKFLLIVDWSVSYTTRKVEP